MLDRCTSCALPLPLCLCPLLPQIDVATQLVLVINHRELRKTTNTGRLAARCLARSEVHIFGAKGAPLSPETLAPRAATNLVLYPSPNAAPLTPELRATFGPKVRLLVPDGDWGQAQKIMRRLPTERLLPVSLPDAPASPYLLRRPARGIPQGVATIEAIARALDVIEAGDAGARLREVFRIFVERTLQSRGSRPP
jgi:DTW domain-containing protein YfiP